MLGRLILSVAVLLAATVGGSSSARSSTVIPEITVRRPPFSERLDKNILSTGGLVLGVAMGELAKPIADEVITVSGLRPTDHMICVAIQHVDGAYTASFRVENPGSSPTVRLRVPSKLIGKLRTKVGALAILAQAGGKEGCNPKSPILPAAWGRVAVTARGYGLVNDHQADLSSARVGAARVQACAAITTFIGTGRTIRSFQVACPIDLSGVCASEADLVVMFVDSGQDSDVRRRVRRPC